MLLSMRGSVPPVPETTSAVQLLYDEFHSVPGCMMHKLIKLKPRCMVRMSMTLSLRLKDTKNTKDILSTAAVIRQVSPVPDTTVGVSVICVRVRVAVCDTNMNCPSTLVTDCVDKLRTPVPAFSMYTRPWMMLVPTGADT